MNKSYLILFTLLTTIILIGCGNSFSETSGVSDDSAASQSIISENENVVSANRVYGADCIGVLTISINPEVDLEINADGNVANVVYQNEDAENAYRMLPLEGTPSEEAIKLIVETAESAGYLGENGEVTLVYGVTGNASAEESQNMIDLARDSVRDTLSELGNNAGVVLEMADYSQNNTDVCEVCHGVGSIICEVCGGSSYGNGMIQCDLYFGSGIYDDGHIPEGSNGSSEEGLCRTCHGTGIMTIQAQTCYICNGSGLCINCGGSGIDSEPDDFGEYGTCHVCAGSGDCPQDVCEGGIMVKRHETCRDCGGTGLDTGNFSGEAIEEEAPEEEALGCYRCEGIGYVLCNRCEGSLMETCYRCGGSGINEH